MRRTIRSLSSDTGQPFLQFLEENPNSSFTIIKNHFRQFTRGQVSDIISILIARDEVSRIINNTRKNRIVYIVAQKEKKGGK
jgi:hypothetical protein